MTVIVCLDDNNGMMFNDRRQSRDQAVLDDIAIISRNNHLYMNEYSYKLFVYMELEHIVVTSNVIQEADQSDYCYIENISIAPFHGEIDRLIIYRWNRTYPADVHLDINLIKEWQLSETAEFIGTSHEEITKEIYLK